MVQLIGVSDWVTQGSVPVPSGAAPGDLLVLFVAGVPTTGRTPAGFTLAGSNTSRFMYLFFPRFRMSIYTSMSKSSVPDEVPVVRRDFAHQLAVFRGTVGVGRVRTAADGIPMEANGGAVFFGGISGQSLDLSGGGFSWRPEHTVQMSMYPAAQVRWGYRDAPAGGGTASVTVNPGAGRVAIELLPPAAPLPPTLLEPETGSQVSVSEPLPMRWLYRPSREGGFQDAYRIRFDIPGVGERWWSASTQSLVTSQETNQGSATQVELPGGLFATGVPVTWQVDTREGLDGEWSGLSDAASFTPVTPPTLSVMGPSGTVMNDLSPLVTWLPVTPEGVQTAYRVEVLDAGATTVYRSGTIPGAGESQRVIGVDWERGGSYRARVQVQQTGGSWSTWIETTFTMDWATPLAPTVTAVPGTDGAALGPEGVTVQVGVEVDPAVYAWTGTPDESTSTRTTASGTVTNLFTNPDMVATSGEVVVWENRSLNPRGLTAWGSLSNATYPIQDREDSYSPIPGVTSVRQERTGNNPSSTIGQATFVGASSASNANSLPVTGGETISSHMWLACERDSWSARVTAHFLDASDQVLENITDGPVQAHAQEGWFRYSATFEVPNGAVKVRFTYTILTDSGDAVEGESAWFCGHTVAPIPEFFDEEYSFDPDLTPQPRPGGGSQLVGQQVAGLVAYNGVVVQSTQWSKSGMYSARLIKNSAGLAYVNVIDPFSATDTASAAVWMYTDKQLTPSPVLPDNFLGVLAVGGSNSPALPGPGEILQRVHRAPGDNAVFAYVYGAFEEMGESIWFDLLTITDTEGYEGPPFSGASPDGIGVAGMQVDRSTATGGWERIVEFIPSGDDGFQDVFARYGEETVYRARTIAELDGMPLSSDWVESAPITNMDAGIYIASALDPIRTWQKIQGWEDSPQVRQRPTSVVYGLGDDRPRVTYGVYRGRSGSLKLWALTLEAVATLVTLLEAGETLILREPPEGVCEPDQLPNRYLSISSEVTVSRWTTITKTTPGRDIEFTWVEQDVTPIGGSDAPADHPIVPNM